MKKFNFLTYGMPDDVKNFSGTPFYMLDAARNIGVLGDAFGVAPSSLRLTKVKYAVKQLLKLQKPRGFQFSRDAAAACTRIFQESNAFDLPILSCHTMALDCRCLPAGVEVYWYIDATPQLLVQHYGLSAYFTPRILRQINRQFKENIERSSCTITFSNWVRRSLLEDYGIDAEKVKVVVPGPNFPCSLLDRAEEIIQSERERLDANYDFVVNYCGLDWRRKGLDILLNVWRIFTGKNRGRFLLRVMGPCPDELSGSCGDSVEFTGRFNKIQDGERYARWLANAHLFCLPTRGDATPIVFRESLSMGTPVVCPNMCGMPDLVRHNVTGLCLDPPVAEEPFLEVLTSCYQNREKFASLRNGVDANRPEVDWRVSIKRMVDYMK